MNPSTDSPLALTIFRAAQAASVLLSASESKALAKALATHPESRPDPGEGLREALAEFMSRWEQDMTHPPSGVVLRYTVVALTAERLADAILADPEVRAALASPVPTDRPEPIDEERERAIGRLLGITGSMIETHDRNPEALAPHPYYWPDLIEARAAVLAAYRTEPGETTDA